MNTPNEPPQLKIGTRVSLHHYTPGFDGPLPCKVGDTGTIVSVRGPNQSGFDYFVKMDKSGSYFFNQGEVVEIVPSSPDSPPAATAAEGKPEKRPIQSLDAIEAEVAANKFWAGLPSSPPRQPRIVWLSFWNLATCRTIFLSATGATIGNALIPRIFSWALPKIMRKTPRPRDAYFLRQKHIARMATSSPQKTRVAMDGVIAFAESVTAS